MAHLAKLFTSQLIQSCNYNVSILCLLLSPYKFTELTMDAVLALRCVPICAAIQCAAVIRSSNNLRERKAIHIFCYSVLLFNVTFIIIPRISLYFLQDATQLDLTNVDPSKLSKLHQRLVAPSNFSTNFQFPGNQMFFKDFIISAENHIIFVEQLKIALVNELIDMNDSSYETMNLTSEAENDVTDCSTSHEYLVKPETLSTLSVLAKFLGFVVAKPFVYDYGSNGVVDDRQLEMRNKVSSFELFYKMEKSRI